MNHPEGTPMSNSLLERRYSTLGQHSPLFYNEPLHLVRGSGIWLTAHDGTRYLDAYNNVPHVGHAHPRVVAAMSEQAATLNVHTRYLNERVVDYAEALLATFEDELDRVFLVNSGSEANDLAFRIATQHTSARGILVTDFSYHGNTSALAAVTTGLTAHEGRGAHVRTFHVPDLDDHAHAGRAEAEVLDEALADVDRALASLESDGYGVAAVIVETLFSTEGLPRVPAGYVTGIAERVRAAGGLVIADEVQAGLGRVGSHFWGYQRHGLLPDLVTLGKPLGNGHPLAAVVTNDALMEQFGARNMYFNTFGGTPVSAAIGEAVLHVMADEGLVARSDRLGRIVRERLSEIVATHPRLGPVKGAGLFFGFGVFSDDQRQIPDADTTKKLVEAVKARGVLISRIGPTDSVLKIRPPLAITEEDLPILLGALEAAVTEVFGEATA